MRGQTGRRERGLARLLMALAIVLIAGLTVTGELRAQEPAGRSWKQLAGVPGPVEHLFAPTSGVLFAQVGLDLYRSDDGGDAWQTVPLPPPGNNATSRQIVVDSASHQHILATGAGGLYRTVDDAASWQLIWPTDPDFPSLVAFAASPVDRDLIYLVVRTPSAHVIRLLRSQDGGQTWSMLEQDGHDFLACTWSVYLLQAHPTDVDRLFRSIDCHHGLLSSVVQESRDRGASWTVIVDAGGARPESVQDPRGRPAPAATPAPTPTPSGRVVPISAKDRPTGVAEILVGGQGAQPSRYCLVVTKPDQGGGMSLLQTDDDGLTWVERLSYAGGGGMTPANDTRPNVTVSSLAVDPAAPDRLYAAFRERVKGQPQTATVRTSADGGQTWTDLGQGLAGPVSDLALGIDGRNLYAATASGVWRLPVGTGAP